MFFMGSSSFKKSGIKKITNSRKKVLKDGIAEIEKRPGVLFFFDSYLKKEEIKEARWRAGVMGGAGTYTHYPPFSAQPSSGHLLPSERKKGKGSLHQEKTNLVARPLITQLIWE